MTVNELQKLMADNSLLTKDTLYELRNLLARYPYFQTARLLYLKNLYLQHDAAFGEELRKAALFVADRRVLYELIEGKPSCKMVAADKPVREMPDVGSANRTMALIDAFLENRKEEVLVPENPDVASDYTSYLLREEEKQESEPQMPRLKGQDLIDCFLQKSAVDERPLAATNDSLPDAMQPELQVGKPADDTLVDENSEESLDMDEDESCLTETLAKIYVKQQRYSKALEIIKKLSLKYPKKNAYFADQIRFLEKLIINTKSK